MLPPTFTTYDKKMARIRPATLKDAVPMLYVKDRARREGYQGLVDEKHLNSLAITPERIAKFQEWLEKCEIFLVYEDHNTILWFICGGLANNQEDLPYPYEIGCLYVDPDRQKKGIGKQLFDAFRQRIGNNQCYLRTLAGSKGEKFYIKHWWTFLGEKKTDIGGQIYAEVWFVFG